MKFSSQNYRQDIVLLASQWNWNIPSLLSCLTIRILNIKFVEKTCVYYELLRLWEINWKYLFPLSTKTQLKQSADSPSSKIQEKIKNLKKLKIILCLIRLDTFKVYICRFSWEYLKTFQEQHLTKDWAALRIVYKLILNFKYISARPHFLKILSQVFNKQYSYLLEVFFVTVSSFIRKKEKVEVKK